MTARSFGCVGACDGEGRLIGVVTDGDLRRHMGASLLGPAGSGNHASLAKDDCRRGAGGGGLGVDEPDRDHVALRRRRRRDIRSAFSTCTTACAPGWRNGHWDEVPGTSRPNEARSPLRRGHGGTRPGGGRKAADRYSRRVALLKRVLPMIGGALLLLVAAWPRLSPLLDSVRLGFAAIDLREARELKMLDPRYAGIDRLNRPYVVTAAVGRQVPNHNNLMSLEQPRAVMTVHGGAKVVLTAATGIYQSQTQLLDLFGGVTLTHQNGTRFVTRRAHADFSDNTAAGHDPIEGHGPAGDIWGQGFRILDKGDTIIFTGRSHSILIGTRPAKATRPPPALPAAVAETAAQIEAAATLPRASPAGVHRSAVAARAGACQAGGDASFRRKIAPEQKTGCRSIFRQKPRRRKAGQAHASPPQGRTRCRLTTGSQQWSCRSRCCGGAGLCRGSPYYSPSWLWARSTRGRRA